MKRIAILGCSGAGKSTLARILGKRFGLPVIHLDQHYWRAGWVEPSREEWRAQALELASRPEWVMDGNYSNTFPERFAVADMIVLLDFPAWLCFWRVIKRTISRYGTTRDDLPEGCPEHFDPKFFKFVAGFRWTHRPKLLAAVEAFPGPKVVLTGPADVARWLSTFDPSSSSPLPASRP